MRSEFSTYLELGFEHISDLNGYDHILFIVALCAIYRPAEWRKVAILVTAFTVGHSITLAMASLDVIPINAPWIEFLIPVTIFITALYNVLRLPEEGETTDLSVRNPRIQLNYLFSLIFGLIHGMGFSNFLRSAMMPGEERSSLVRQLLAFNIGVELGQLTIVAVILLAAFLAFRVLHIAQRDWTLFISGAAAGVSLIMALERIPVA